LVTLLAAGLFAAAPVHAQIDSSQVGCAKCLWRTETELVGKWTYKYDSSMGEPKITPAEAAALRATLLQISEIAHATPVMTARKGISAWVWARLDMGCPFNQMLCHWKPLGAWEDVIVDMHLLNVKTGARSLMNQESPRVHIAVNDPTQLYVYGGHKSTFIGENGYDILGVLEQVGEVGGLPLYDNQLIIVSGKRPLFVPVSREAYIRGIIHTFYLKAASDGGDKTTADYFAATLRKELAGMSADERASQAYTSRNSQLTSMLAPADEAGATPMIMFNPDYFDTTLPRTAVQLITVRTVEPGLDTNNPDPETSDTRVDAVWRLRNTIDYAKLRLLLVK
ncbi:MAG TPA: hypothetical protein VM100_03840, partial [Longimicrobiales bacterium]|nr:hypothetical protein [Longimicrobiales bacterium]